MRTAKHNLSNYKLLTCDMGQLVPCGLTEVLPGDRFRHNASVFVRFSPMAAPVMHPVSVRVHHFFVPMRLCWPEGTTPSWEDFITGGPNNDVSTALPTFQPARSNNDLLDYLGVPVVTNLAISKLPVIAYNKIFNEFFRDQDLTTVVAEESNAIQNIAWEKDYHTTARPWPQKGGDVTLPLGTSAPVRGQTADQTYNSMSTGSDKQLYTSSPAAAGREVWADLSEAASAKVNDIRAAFALQRFAEVRARFGSRYSEYLQYLGVRAPDARLQRPEYLGGGRFQMSISEVLQTSPDGTTPRFGVGDMYGHGVSLGRSNSYRRRFNEHGYVMSLLSIRPKQMFMNGVSRTWLRQHREDFWQKELQYIGQQQVLEQELYATDSNKDNVFGYSDRYQEYRGERSTVAAEFRNIFDYWHLSRKFGSAPALNDTFVKCVPSKRIFNDENQHSCWIAVDHTIQARRLVSRIAQGRLF